MKIPTPGFLLTALIQVCRRFPGAIIFAALGTAACTLLVENGNTRDASDFYTRNWITCLLGLPFLTALVVFSESKGWSENRKWLLQGLGFIAVAGCWFWLDTKAENFEYQILPQYFALLMVGHLAVAVAPYLNARSVRHFWDYNREIFANLVVGAAFTLILFAGLALAILAVDNLFNMHIKETMYAKLFILLAGIFNTSYFLFHFPPSKEIEPAVAGDSAIKEEAGAYNWVFRSLCKYILLPIVLLYFLILYAYGAKIGIQWTLPKGWVSSLVIGFSVAGIFTYLLNFYLGEEDNSWIVKGFKRYFWWVLLPLTVLLFIAIGTRIGDYGVTEERYLVAQLGVWLAVSCLYFLFSKHDNIKFIPISLALFALLWAFGPLSAFAVSRRSQQGILTGILAQYGRFENGQLKPGTMPLPEEDREKVISIAWYLKNRNALAELLPIQRDSAWWTTHDGFMKWLQIETDHQKANRQLVFSPEDEYTARDLRGYDFGYKIALRPGKSQDEKEPGNYFSLSEDGKTLQWHQRKDGKLTLVEMYSLAPAMQKWWEKHDDEKPYTYIRMPLEELTLQLSGRKNSIRLYIEQAEIEYKNHAPQFTHLKGMVLVKTK